MLTKQQIDYLRLQGLNLDYDHLTNDDWVAIEDVVSNKLQTFGFDKEYAITSDGKMCESILDNLP